MKSTDETGLFEKIKNSDIQAFEFMFHQYYGYLCLYAAKILNDSDTAEEIVQDFFVRLWEKREQLSIETSVKNYFFRSIKNLCINSIQHDKVKAKHAQKIISEIKNSIVFDDHYIEPDLAKKIEESIQLLPEKRREIFLLSREEGLKYREIAEKLNVSIKTVETQMSLAIKTLRDNLKNFSRFLFFF
jgi:RNA polymerase sigma-70 factor (ECF subfamily)